MNLKFGLMAVTVSLTLISGCVAYAPYADYSGGPYGGYGYAAPVVPVPIPMFYGGWRSHGHHWHHGHH